jgi:hypothetical protein
MQAQSDDTPKEYVYVYQFSNIITSVKIIISSDFINEYGKFIRKF